MADLILIVDDEADLVQILDYNLKREGYATRLAYSGLQAMEKVSQDPLPDLVILDLMLPDIPGTEVCRRMRSNPRTAAIAVLMLTAKGEEIDRVVGFEIGADDYVIKPFSVRELVLRIKAILRRGVPDGVEAETLSFGCLSIDIPGHRALVDGEEIALTSLEFKLLTTFLNRKGRVQRREVLLTDVWDVSAEMTTRTVDTHIKRLREKLKNAGTYLETIRGVGYRFRQHP